METLTAEDFIRRGRMLREMLISLIQQGKMQELLIDIPYMKDFQEKWHQEGQRQTLSDMIHQILDRDFPIKLGVYQEYFDQLTLAELQQLSEVALKVDSLAEFEAALDAILQEK